MFMFVPSVRGGSVDFGSPRVLGVIGSGERCVMFSSMYGVGVYSVSIDTDGGCSGPVRAKSTCCVGSGRLMGVGIIERS